jgi:predicted N-acetyltransferase YhbS
MVQRQPKGMPAGWASVVVLGHPEYSPRFGFVRASAFGISCEYPVPDDVFMAMVLADRCVLSWRDRWNWS